MFVCRYNCSSTVLFLLQHLLRIRAIIFESSHPDRRDKLHQSNDDSRATIPLPSLENPTRLFHVMVVAVSGWNAKDPHLPARLRHQSDSASQERQGFSWLRRRCPRYGSWRRRRYSEGRAEGSACEGVLLLAEAWAHTCVGETTQRGAITSFLEGDTPCSKLRL